MTKRDLVGKIAGETQLHQEEVMVVVQKLRSIRNRSPPGTQRTQSEEAGKRSRHSGTRRREVPLRKSFKRKS